MSMLLKEVAGNDQLRKRIKKIKPIYKQAGHIRASGLFHTMLTGYQNFSSDSALRILERIIGEETNMFSSHRDQIIAGLQKSRAGKISFKAIPGKKIIAFLHALLHEIHVLCKNSPDAEALHAARKKIKILVYLHEMLPASIAEKSGLKILYLSRLQHLIGEFNDHHGLHAELKNMYGIQSGLLLHINQIVKAKYARIMGMITDFEKKSMYAAYLKKH